ncbi:dTDP-glucose 4,6-dehydratase [Candidatus Sumerlaeota bacterium]|nr:dTDP-glucose 4,6-dehydratase [Candidatus Sumerlaeota bacterium]
MRGSGRREGQGCFVVPVGKIHNSPWLVTGGCGFIGSNLIRYLLAHRRDLKIVNLDKLTYAGNTANLADLPAQQAARHRLVKADIADARAVRKALKTHRPPVVLHLAAESHVDRSLTDAAPFIRTNVLGTQVLLEAAAEFGVKRFVHVSTDEVYGSLGAKGYFTENSPLAPNSPYAASKAASDLLARAYHRSFGLDLVITRCCNNYGPYQFPEKLIPLMIKNALNDQPLPVYGDGLNVRDWIHVEDHARAIIAIAEKGSAGEIYNVGARSEWKNIDLVRLILKTLGKPESLIRFVEDRAGHDRRYAVDPAKIEREIGWKPRIGFEKGLRTTIEWYVKNRSWWEAVLSGEYRKFYSRYYGARLRKSLTKSD